MKTSREEIEYLAHMLDEAMSEKKEDIDECDGGCACGGDCGGAPVGGGDAGIGTGDVLGNCDHSAGHGYLGAGCFHVPMPAFGWTTKKGKKRKNGTVPMQIPGKNPYVKGAKIIKEFDIPVPEKFVSRRFVNEMAVVPHYVGDAKREFDKVVQGQTEYDEGRLYFNDKFRIGWLIRDDGVLRIYKPILENGYWTVYATILLDDGTILLDYVSGRFSSEQAALDAVYRAAEKHQKAKDAQNG